MPSTDVITKPTVDTEVKLPNLYKVIYINDNKTTFDFVIQSLMDYFKYDVATAEKAAVQVHTDGFAIVAIMPYEIAEQKSVEVMQEARINGFPLQVRIEEDD